MSDDEAEAIQTLQCGVQARSDAEINRGGYDGQGRLRRTRDQYTAVSPLARELELLGNEAFPGNGRSRDQEQTDLKRELAKVKKERDFLKEAAAYFAKASR